AYYKTDDPDSAARELSKVVAAQPENQQARLLLGLSLYQLDLVNDAVSELQAVYRAQPDNLAAAYALGSAYISLGRTDEAGELIGKVLSGVDSAEAHLIIRSLHLAHKEMNPAIEELNADTAINPRHPTLHSQLALAYLF